MSSKLHGKKSPKDVGARSTPRGTLILINQLEQRAGSEIFFGTHSSWGFGMAVDIQRNEIFHTPGRFGWTGGFGTSAYTDPAEGMIGILFTQRMMDSPESPKVFTDFWTLAYGAME
jgi:CubicO group peptidase (beta-lactamase class C family)